MAQKVNNPRWGHTCKICYYTGVSSFSDGELVELYNGKCRKSSSANIRTFSSGNTENGKVETADYRISIPGKVVGLKKGYFVFVTDDISTDVGMRVVDFAYSPMANATEILCNTNSN
jgi:hypothetical protein